MTNSFVFYDLETFGQDPRRTRIAQFAALRTDLDLECIEPAEHFFIQPAQDLLPAPRASVITGITPQHALREGINEASAFDRIARIFAKTGTCALGYNSLRFDDEFIRFGLYRNFHDPYAREWQNGNSRWDILDLMRLMYALRPNGIQWPSRTDGSPSFRLEDLAMANAVRDGQAHEALSDVKATIGLARCVRHNQPKLWQYALRLRDRRYCAQLLDTRSDRPVLHISHRYPANRCCAAAILPIAQHPSISNRMIVCDLSSDTSALLDLSIAQIHDCLFTPRADLPADAAVLGLKQIHLTKSPALVRWQHLRHADFDRLQLNSSQVVKQAKQLRCHQILLHEKLQRVFAQSPPPSSSDADAALYEGFVCAHDRALLPLIRQSPAKDLDTFATQLHDPRMKTLLLRYRARNWPDTLTSIDADRWDAYRRNRLSENSGLSEFTFSQYAAEIEYLRGQTGMDGATHTLLDQLTAWGISLQHGL